MITSEETRILAANEAFYEAFSRRDFAAMDALWAREAPVACIHPGWDAIRGREEVMASWRAILQNPAGPPVTYVGATVHRMGEVAFVVCTELVSGVRLVATNIFLQEEGAWRMVHHQAGPAAQRFAIRQDPPRGPLN